MSKKQNTVPSNVVFNDLIEGLQDAIEWTRGEKPLPTTEIVQDEFITRQETKAQLQKRRAAGDDNATEASQVTRAYVILYTRDKEGWKAIVPDIPGVEAIGDSLEEAQNLVRYFIQRHLCQLREEGKSLPESKTRAEQVSFAA